MAAFRPRRVPGSHPALVSALALIGATVAPARQQPVPDAARISAELEARHPPPSVPLRAVYEGRWSQEAHLAKPHDERRLAIRSTLLDDGAARARLDRETWRESAPERVAVETTWLDGERVLHRESAAAPARECRGDRAAILRRRVAALAPWRAAADSREPGGAARAPEPTTLVLAGRSGTGEVERRIGVRDGRLASVSVAFAHPRLGDSFDETSWSEWSEREGVALAGALAIRAPGGDEPDGEPESFELRLARVEAGVAFAEAYALPADATPEPPRPDPRAVEIAVEELLPGVHSFASVELDARGIVVEFADHAVALGAPLSSALGERIVASIARRLPDKPLRYVLFGHHHPHYTGGLRAFLDAGAIVLATPANARSASEIAARRFTFEPDAWARRGGEARIEAFDGRRELADAARRLVAIDIGSRSAHTDEYLVFHLPRERALIQDDIGWFAPGDGSPSFGDRSRGLRDAIVELGLDVRTLWQGWPVANHRASISFAELDAGVAAARAR
jgi:hypothetical protein